MAITKKFLSERPFFRWRQRDFTVNFLLKDGASRYPNGHDHHHDQANERPWTRWQLAANNSQFCLDWHCYIALRPTALQPMWMISTLYPPKYVAQQHCFQWDRRVGFRLNLLCCSREQLSRKPSQITRIMELVCAALSDLNYDDKLRTINSGK